MNTLNIDHKNGNFTDYKLIEDGGDLPIAYKVNTPEKVIQVLEHCRRNRIRVKLHYGDLETGRDWNEENDVTGYVSLSRGHKARFPILVNNTQSMGGGRILDDCIIKIKRSAGGNVIYKADNYKEQTFEIVPSDMTEYEAVLKINGSLYSRHRTRRSAERLMKKLS